MTSPTRKGMAVPRTFAGCLAVGFLGIAMCGRGEARPNGDDERELAQSDAPADAALAVTTAETERVAYEAKWLPAVKEIGRQIEIDRHHAGQMNMWIRMLGKINTPQSRVLLRQIAIGEIKTPNPHCESWAATSLLSCDKTECWMLFSSNNPNVLRSALDAVAGQPVDEARLEILKTCSKHSITFVRYHAAEVLGNVAPSPLALDAMECIGQTLATVGKSTDIDSTKDRHLSVSPTPDDLAYLQLMFALAKVRVDNQALHKLAAKRTGRSRDTIILALAQRGDTSVRPLILKLAQDPDAELLRAWAVCGLANIGTVEDLPLLRKIATTDPLTRVMMPWCVREIDDRPYYPVRSFANDTIRTLERKAMK